MSTQQLKPKDPGFWPAMREKLNNATPPQLKMAAKNKKDKK
jgi:hypothetical protein